MDDRNLAEVFAKRTRHNLEFIEKAARNGDDVHRVIQITLSLLGLVVFPREKDALGPALLRKSMADMKRDGWPMWHFDLGEEETENLDDVLRHLRNAVAHGLLSFDSDSREPSDVYVTVEDAEDDYSPVYWSATMRADKLREFCYRLLGFIEDTVG